MSRKNKYTKRFKLKAVQSVLRDHLSLTQVSDELGINKSDLKKWISYYRTYGVLGLLPRTKNTIYPIDFKLKVIHSIEQKGLSFRAAALKYNIPSFSTVRSWYHMYLDKGILGLHAKPRGRPKVMKNKTKKASSKKTLTREEELLHEIESLKSELAFLKKLEALTQAKNKKQ